MADLSAGTFSFYLFDGEDPKVAVYLTLPREGGLLPYLEVVDIHLQEVAEEDPKARLKELLIQVVEHL